MLIKLWGDDIKQADYYADKAGRMRDVKNYLWAKETANTNEHMCELVNFFHTHKQPPLIQVHYVPLLMFQCVKLYAFSSAYFYLLWCCKRIKRKLQYVCVLNDAIEFYEAQHTPRGGSYFMQFFCNHSGINQRNFPSLDTFTHTYTRCNYVWIQKYKIKGWTQWSNFWVAQGSMHNE